MGGASVWGLGRTADDREMFHQVKLNNTVAAQVFTY